MLADQQKMYANVYSLKVRRKRQKPTPPKSENMVAGQGGVSSFISSKILPEDVQSSVWLARPQIL